MKGRERKGRAGGKRKNFNSCFRYRWPSLYLIYVPNLFYSTLLYSHLLYSPPPPPHYTTPISSRHE